MNSSYGMVSVWFYFDNDDLGIHQELKTRREPLETSVGSELSWEDLPHRTASRISLYRPGSIEREDEYPGYVDWFIESQERLRSAVERGEAEKVV
jgi:Domain of unknown function (DUF4268)